MNALRFLSCLLLAVWLDCGSARAEKRVALVIGNATYQTVPELATPLNDATVVGGMFREAGFDAVDVKLDLGVAEMRKALREFGNTAREAEVAVVYYAGHGIALDGTNYLIPIDAKLETDTDILDETLPLDRVLFAIEPAKRLRLVILDACRDNPFVETLKRTVATRGMGRGLARVEPSTPNTMIAFAAKAGSTAPDGDAANSLFATALVERLPTPGLGVSKAFGFVRDDVLKTTRSRQEPYLYGSLRGDDVPLVAAKPAATGRPLNAQDAARRDYELAQQVGTPEVWRAFLARYPEGFFASLATEQLNKIAAEEARVAAEKAVAEQGAGKAAEPQPKAESEKQTAALEPAPQSRPSPQEIAGMMQSELRRVGCLSSTTDGWDSAAQRSLTQFNKFAGTNVDVKVASLDALDALKSKQGRVCPLVCDRGFRADGDSCVKIPDKKPVATRDGSGIGNADRKPAETTPTKPQPPAKPQASGQIICGQGGCRPVRPGCRIAGPSGGRWVGPGNVIGTAREICD